MVRGITSVDSYHFWKPCDIHIRYARVRTDIQYPSHSHDLSPDDAYVWGMLKKPFFREQLMATIDELCENIVATVTGMNQPLFRDMLGNLCSHYEFCLQHNGKHIEYVR